MDRVKKSKLDIYNESDYIMQKTSSSAETGLRSIHDMTNRDYSHDIALDNVERDLHEPSMEELAEFYGFTIEEIRD